MELLISLLSILIFFLHLLTPSQSQTDSYYYDHCAPFACGKLTVAFPFSSSETFCAPPGFEISCSSSMIPTLTLSDVRNELEQISRKDCVIVVSDTQLTKNLQSNTCDGLQKHFLPAAKFTPFQLPSWGINLNFSLCGHHGELPPTFTQVAVNCSGGCAGNESLYAFPPSNGTYDGDSVPAAPCVHAAHPVQLESLLKRGNILVHRDDIFSVLNEGFPLQWDNFTYCWECEEKGGRCGYNRSTGNTTCFCKYGCSQGGHLGTGRTKAWKIIVAVVVPTTFVLLAGLIAFIKFRSRALSIFNSLSNRSISQSGNADVEEFMKSYRSMLPTEFSYTTVRKITDGFKEKLGEGGYGNVYKGKLPNGQLVAAKILEKSKNNGRDFVNEVATIGRIHHVNIIRLLGFCCDGSHRALIYEFMPKGSLGDLISKEEITHTIGVPRLLKIAIGIARGIEYLHQGCERRILHLDIKPHNVLLDNNLHPKISDFGLAKSYSHKDSTVTLTGGARGTIGYIAPEVFLRSLGGVSRKSDVYSYGMLLLEMVMGKKNERPETEHSSKEYFPDRIYDQLNQWSDLERGDVVIEEDTGISKKMVMVGLWCIQTNPVHRPSISTVLEMLTGEVERIEMPPKPVSFSLPRQQLECNISFTDSGGEGSLHTPET
ncbi:rust resistance kinase Lr10 [Cocos nucifera]|uniref:Rust resistance kinase Lr10 n=1 Tax=Cocos nucifera TaxID=13894 RepID=A0A8K0MWR1_COCNU|nr:rust resistance kinase Lr10 [Cocos nucifera]